jgi:sulfur-carrier protein
VRAILQRYDGLRERIAEDGDLRRFVNVYVGGEDRDEVTILPAVAGGA